MNLKQTALGLSFALSAAPALAAPQPEAANNTGAVDKKLNELKLPENGAPATITAEKLYAVQNRYSRLANRSEITIGGATNFTSNSLINSSQIDLAYRYHLSNRWDLSMSGSYAFNSLTANAKAIYNTQNGKLPDVAYVKSRADILAGFNLFYGKMRFGMDSVAYFDQYVAVGPGLISTQFGTSPAAVADVGVAFWIGQHWNMRLGFKNSLYKEKTMLSEGMAYHLLGHVDLGFTFGEG